MCGAVAAGRLTVVMPVLENWTWIGTSPAPAKDEGKVKFMTSNPGISGFGRTERIEVPVIGVVPTVIVISAGVARRTPVTLSSIMVGTVAPLASVEVTVNGSGVRALGLVTFKAIARPPASLVVVKMSGCATMICTNPR